MNFIINIWNKIKKPHGFYLVLFYVSFFIITISTLLLVIFEQEQSVLHYILYFCSAILLSYFVYTMIIFIPRIRSGIIRQLKKHKFTRTILSDYGYRTIMFSIFSFVINLAYFVFMGVIGIMSKSAWYLSMTAYYLALSLMKGNVFYSKRKHNTPLKQARAYRYAGIMFILMTIVFSGIIVLIYTANRHFEYPGIMIYVVATYTFYRLSLAIFNIFKAKSHTNLYIQTIRNINLASALISIVVLQVAMFQSFAPELNNSFANGLTGGFMSIIILSLGIWMITKANKQIKLLEKTNDNKQ